MVLAGFTAKVVPAGVPSTIGCNVTAPVPCCAVAWIPAVQSDAAW